MSDYEAAVKEWAEAKRDYEKWLEDTTPCVEDGSPCPSCDWGVRAEKRLEEAGAVLLALAPRRGREEGKP